LHTRIVVASGNQFFQQMAAIIRGALAAVNPIVLNKEGAWESVVANHGRVVEAIERRDPKAAEAASLALIDYTAEEIGNMFSVERPVDG
jgi:DNA-binding FadR family transcriptional regulator